MSIGFPWRRKLSPVLPAAALAVLVVGGCETLFEDAQGTPPAPPAETMAVPIPAPIPAPIPIPIPVPAPAPAVEEAPAAQQALAVPPPVSYPEPERLFGLGPGQVAELLGDPRFKRRDDPAQIWQYGTEGCVFDIFLYKAEGKYTYVVTHFEARRPGGEGVSARDCFHALIEARREAGG